MKFLLFVMILIPGLWFLARILEQGSIYFPDRHLDHSPKELNLTHKEISILSGKHQLQAWHFANGNSQVLLYLHGNAGNRSHRLPKIQQMLLAGWDVFIVDYRGYGGSTGTPNEAGLYDDAQAAYAELLKSYLASGIVLYGESLGGPVAVELARRVPVGGVILENTFTSIPAMSQRIYPFIPTFFIQTKLDSLSKIADLKSPLLIFHGLHDEITPFTMGKQLFEKATVPDKSFVELSGSHNTAYHDSLELWKNALRNFKDKIK